MTDYTKICLVALAVGLVAFGWVVLSLWLGDAIVPIRHYWDLSITREDYPFWFWFLIVVGIVVGILFVYGGIDGLIAGAASNP